MCSPPRFDPCPTVELLHELPDGSCHVDWLLSPDPEGREPLVTFRLPDRVDHLGGDGRTSIAAERREDHRPVYLRYEGPLADAPGSTQPAVDRGRVRRLRAGRLVEWDRADGWTLTIEWDPEGDEPPPARRQRVRLHRIAGNDWRVEAVS